jgi:esterase/lipase superfamily enzyme
MQTSKHLHRALPIILVVTLMAACIPDGNSKTQPDTNKSASTMAQADNGMLRTVPFLTLRNKTGSKNVSKYFGGERSVLQAGFCDLSHISLNTLKPVAERASFYIPEDIVKLESIRMSSAEGFWPGMERLLDGQPPILYAHGFFISFERGCKRASLLQESLELTGRLVLFSWPSDGAILNYTRDESDLYWSVDPLREVLLDMISRFGAGNINLAAHSLGTRGVMLALVRLAQADKGNRPLVNQVILIAPDIDAGIFKQYLPLIRPLARNITVYVSSNDSPLALSRKVHGYPRLGESGTHLEGLTGIDIIDLSDISVQYTSGHVHHLYNDIVADDISQLLNMNMPASQRSNLEHTGGNHWRLRPTSQPGGPSAP